MAEYESESRSESPRKKSEFNPVRRPGAATRAAKRAGMSLSKWARKNYHAPGRKGKEARFVEIRKKWRSAGKHRQVATRKSSRRGSRG